MREPIIKLRPAALVLIPSENVNVTEKTTFCRENRDGKTTVLTKPLGFWY